jgi:tetratricopeptide (TPR) repeat protein
MLIEKRYQELEEFAIQHSEDSSEQSYRAFQYLGISHFKRHEYKLARHFSERALVINPGDAQVYYNLALCNFKLQNYKTAKLQFEKVVQLDPAHPYAYNNLAFLFNMFQMYTDTLHICREAKDHNKHGHRTHRHWAFAEFKSGQTVPALKKIRKACSKYPKEPENWVMWGMILRHCGRYESALHKLKKAQRLAPDSLLVRSELDFVTALLQLDRELPNDAIVRIDECAYDEAHETASVVDYIKQEGSNGFCQLF